MPVIQFDAERHEYFVDGRSVLNVSTILERAGMGVDYSQIPPAVLAHARERGAYVDGCCDLFDQDALDVEGVHEEALSYVQAWGLFCKEKQFRPFAHQKIVYHREMDYAGTFDALGYDAEGRVVLIDRKCTAKIADSYGVQLAAYCFPGIALIETDLPPVERRLVVQLRPNGTYVVKEYTRVEDFDAFKAAWVIAKWKGASIFGGHARPRIAGSGSRAPTITT